VKVGTVTDFNTGEYVLVYSTVEDKYDKKFREDSTIKIELIA